MPKRFCSQRCQKIVWRRENPGYTSYWPRCAVFVRDCAWCGSVFVGRGRTAVTCGKECRKERCAALQRERYRSDPDRYRAKAVSERAAWTPEQIAEERARAKAWRDLVGYHPSKRAGDVRRRMRLASAEVESFAAEEIYERDGWRCGICRRKVDRSLRHPDPMSPSLDHIVPLSLDGAHTRANARLAHLRCNVARGNRGGAEQLALLG